MTIPRMVAMLVVLAVLGLAIVVMRVDQSIIARRIQVLQFRQSELRQKLWSQEIELARLRSLKEIRERAEELGVPVASSDESVSVSRR